MNELHLTCKNMDESHKDNVKQKNPEIKESRTKDVKLIYGVRILHSTSDSRVEVLVTRRGTR